MTHPRIRNRGAQAGFAVLLALAMLLLPALALAQPAGAPKGNPRLASLNIEIWPEYDRPAALVILRGAVAENVKLPAAVTLRLPAAAGDAIAVAYSATADGNLLNMKNDRAIAGEFITLKFETPQRFFHVEFYLPIATTAPARSFRYAWPGDLAVDRVTVVVQEPAAARDISVEPNLGRATLGQDGLQYRDTDLGALEAGKPLAIAIRYTKSDTRTSTEIVKPNAGGSASLAAAPPPATAPASIAAPASGGLPDWALPLGGLVLLGLLGAALILWQWRRAAPAAAPAGRACAKCGAAQAPGNRFCSNCGAKVA